MSLKEYREKRKFDQTPEPSGRLRHAGNRDRIFVVQKHDATSLHYDFRIRVNGVLASWAVPKGPSMNPADKRLAMRTEDHPFEYADFEGVIPEGHYGAGTIMVWDKGTYDLSDGLPAEKQLRRGEMKIVLHGKRLRGSFVLVQSQDKRWLLIKYRDKYSDTSSTMHASDRSALTGRTLKQIAKSG